MVNISFALQVPYQNPETLRQKDPVMVDIFYCRFPSKIRNLNAESRSFDKHNIRPSIRLLLDHPIDNGGAVVSRYIISYMPCEQSWKLPTTKKAKANEFNDLNLWCCYGVVVMVLVHHQMR